MKILVISLNDRAYSDMDVDWGEPFTDVNIKIRMWIEGNCLRVHDMLI